MITPDKTSIRVLKKKIAKRDSYEKKIQRWKNLRTTKLKIDNVYISVSIRSSILSSTIERTNEHVLEQAE